MRFSGWLAQQRARIAEVLRAAPQPQAAVDNLRRQILHMARRPRGASFGVRMASRTLFLALLTASGAGRAHAPRKRACSLAHADIVRLSPREEYASVLFHLHVQSPLDDPSEQEQLEKKATQIERRLGISRRYARV